MPTTRTRPRSCSRRPAIRDGFKVTLKLPPPSYARRGGEIIAQQLKAVGVDAQIIPVEWAQWLSDVFKNKDYDLTIVSHTEPADYGIYARDDYYFDYHSDAFKKLMDELNLATDPAKRNALIGDIQKKIAEDAVNVFLFELAKTGVWNAKIKGLWANSPIQANDLTKVYLGGLRDTDAGRRRGAAGPGP